MFLFFETAVALQNNKMMFRMLEWSWKCDDGKLSLVLPVAAVVLLLQKYFLGSLLFYVYEDKFVLSFFWFKIIWLSTALSFIWI